ncbi:hypothetical protein [Bosea sp. CRIB-10]|uniref:hypothetical protein n=1 Tax=Bosea sp. CRIB-10 TaxID=378404 RepID=UPI000B838B1C|nr:hypothetical protein [Bosea sp. CRIB-10]
MVAQQAEPLWTLRQTPFALQPSSGWLQTRAMQADALLLTLLQFCSQLLNIAEQELVTCLQPSWACTGPFRSMTNDAAMPVMIANLFMPTPSATEQRS